MPERRPERGESAPALLREAFERWIAAQRDAVELVLNTDHPGHPVDWAEGFRWVTRIASLAQNWAVEKDDPLRPEIFLLQGPARKMIVDNPDVNYWFAPLDPAEEYRLTGTRGSSRYVGLTLGTDFLRGAGAGGPTGTLGQYDLDQFDLADDGGYEIVLSRSSHEGNWIELVDGMAQLAVRETFIDRSQEVAATYRLERIGDALPPPVLSPERCAEQLENAARLILFIVRTCVAMWQASANRINVIEGAAGQRHVDEQDDEVRSHSDTDMAYYGGRWKLAQGQALSVTIHPPPGPSLYWGLTLVNPWGESYEYRYSEVCTNIGLAQPNDDGSWTVLIAAEDPGVPNWLDTGGRLEGFALIRWVFPGSLPENPTCELVSIDSLA